MSNWLTMDPASPRCCLISIAVRKGKDPFAKDGGTLVCSECGRTWARDGDELKEKKV